jgi:hypothetical protein
VAARNLISLVYADKKEQYKAYKDHNQSRKKETFYLLENYRIGQLGKFPEFIVSGLNSYLENLILKVFIQKKKVISFIRQIAKDFLALGIFCLVLLLGAGEHRYQSSIEN